MIKTVFEHIYEIQKLYSTFTLECFPDTINTTNFRQDVNVNILNNIANSEASGNEDDYTDFINNFSQVSEHMDKALTTVMAETKEEYSYIAENGIINSDELVIDVSSINISEVVKVIATNNSGVSTELLNGKVFNNPNNMSYLYRINTAEILITINSDFPTSYTNCSFNIIYYPKSEKLISFYDTIALTPLWSDYFNALVHYNAIKLTTQPSNAGVDPVFLNLRLLRGNALKAQNATNKQYVVHKTTHGSL